MTPNASDVLLVVDMQHDFLPGGALAVNDGDAIIEGIARLAERFENVVLTQDWHPADHVSFASNHPGKTVFETTELAYGTQVLWPDHCVIGSRGAEIHPDMPIDRAQMIIRKGFRTGIDSYSAFREANRRTLTGLAGYLRERGLSRIFLVGLATDFCVGWSALDARSAGFEAVLVEDLTRGIDTNGSLERALGDMQRNGVGRLQSAELLA